MRIFKALGIDDGCLAYPTEESNFTTIVDKINGERQSPTWPTLEFELIRRDGNRVLRDVDMPWLGSNALIMNGRAKAAFEPKLNLEGEFLPLKINPALWLYNPLSVIDALDEEHSKIRRFKDGRIMLIELHAFHTHRIGEKMTFKLANLRASPTFLTAGFIEIYESAGLSGLEFKEL